MDDEQLDDVLSSLRALTDAVHKLGLNKASLPNGIPMGAIELLSFNLNDRLDALHTPTRVRFALAALQGLIARIDTACSIDIEALTDSAWEIADMMNDKE